MRTVVLGEPPVEFERLIKRRQELGQDLFDEVWEGEYHVAPAPSSRHGMTELNLASVLLPRALRAGLKASGPCNIGAPDDYRVPDQTYFLDGTPSAVFNPTAEIVVEIVSPGDESRQKFDFYHQRGVKELLIVDPDERTVEWFARDADGFRPAEGSALLDVAAAVLAGELSWPD